MKAPTTPALRLIDLAPTPADFGSELLAGLRCSPRRLPCKFFYDAVGSRLFELICETPEYYPTRVEYGILADSCREIAAFCGPRCRLVELGSGSSLKTRRLLDALVDPAAYVPIDISRRHLWLSAVVLAEEYPSLPILPVCADYLQALELPESPRLADRTVVFFPGSTIGNFEPAEAVEFLERIAGWCEPGDRLILGADLEKPHHILQAAYNDAAGVTAAFNLNLLARANRELGADFGLDAWRHQAVYDQTWRRIEMRLISRRAQTVHVAGETFRFGENEIIVTEYSHKFTRRGLCSLAESAGWMPRDLWTDDRAWFGVFAFERVR